MFFAVVLLLLLTWGSVYLVEWYRKKANVALAIDEFKPVPGVRSELNALIADIRDKNVQMSGSFMKTNYGNLYIAAGDRHSFKHFSKLSFTPTIVEWDILYGIAKKLR